MKQKAMTAYPLLGYELGTNEARPTQALLNLHTEQGVHSYTLDGEALDELAVVFQKTSAKLIHRRDLS